MKLLVLLIAILFAGSLLLANAASDEARGARPAPTMEAP